MPIARKVPPLMPPSVPIAEIVKDRDGTMKVIPTTAWVEREKQIQELLKEIVAAIP